MKYVVVGGLVLISLFYGLMVAAGETTKEVHVKSGAMESDDMILQTKEAKASEVALYHAVVLGLEHLRSISEITVELPEGVLSTRINAVMKVEHEGLSLTKTLFFFGQQQLYIYIYSYGPKRTAP